MKRIGKLVLIFSLVAGLLTSPVAGGKAGAGWGQVAKTVAKDLVTPLAGHFGVPVAPVSALFQSGLTLEGVVQALLISQASKKSVDQVGSTLGANGNDMDATAKALAVEPSVYSEDKVASVIGEVTGTTGETNGSETSSSVGEAKGEAQSATEEAKKSLGGFLRSQ
jgi:hypothetical protein